MKTKGIVIIALGNYMYGKMALTLAVSIKATSPDIPICLIHAGEGLKHITEENQKRFFDKLIKAPEKSYTVKGEQQFLRVKTCIYDLSPYDETLYLDADMIWSQHKPVSVLFDELKEVQFTMINEGNISMKTGEGSLSKRYTLWGGQEEIMKAWETTPGFVEGKLYQMRSELIYFKKSDENKTYFNLVKKIYDNPRIDLIQLGEGTPDEYAYNIASCILHQYPHEDNYCPLYWHYMHKDQRKEISQITREYYAISIGGNVIPVKVQDWYNSLAQMFFKRLGIQHPYKARGKWEYLNNRKKL